MVGGLLKRRLGLDAELTHRVGELFGRALGVLALLGERFGSLAGFLLRLAIRLGCLEYLTLSRIAAVAQLFEVGLGLFGFFL
ncbi:MAG: hypothetical protein BRD57_06525 [Proteobacteria bacterium SW_6_67_9]|nr:MAG: hypothetical protein BRD57_06525 [Proteobacteria bacterium SW_6_67_9]